MSAYFIPILFIAIFLYAIIKKVKPYDAFIEGAKSSVPFVLSVFPYLTAILILTELLQISGVGSLLEKILSPIFNLFGIPTELSKLVLIKPFSGSGSLAVLSEIYSKYGVDGYLARCASAIYGSSETVFYVASVYFATAKSKPPIKAIAISLIASFISFCFACLICKIL
ncbi:MAG: spore maturation protein [Clostridia bacterium]|nr:spore maturation protein [Clostridia bacterium]